MGTKRSQITRNGVITFHKSFGGNVDSFSPLSTVARRETINFFYSSHWNCFIPLFPASAEQLIL